jgi:hypothetical protein
MRPKPLDQPLMICAGSNAKGLILKMPHSHRYQLTPLGRSGGALYQNLWASPGSRFDLARSQTTRSPQATQPSGHGLATA